MTVCNTKIIHMFESSVQRQKHWIKLGKLSGAVFKTFRWLSTLTLPEWWADLSWLAAGGATGVGGWWRGGGDRRRRVVGPMWGGGGGGGGAGGVQRPGQQQGGRHTQPCLQVGELGVAQHLQNTEGGDHSRLSSSPPAPEQDPPDAHNMDRNMVTSPLPLLGCHPSRLQSGRCRTSWSLAMTAKQRSYQNPQTSSAISVWGQDQVRTGQLSVWTHKYSSQTETSDGRCVADSQQHIIKPPLVSWHAAVCCHFHSWLIL